MQETLISLKPSDVRPGNWLSHEYTGPFQWDWKHYADYVKDKRDGYELSHLNADAVISDKIEPIPLTPEILEKCGFAKDSRGFWFISDADGDRLEFERIDENGILQPYMYYTGANISEKAKPKYLHQLQNLYFALTGEELGINL